MAGQLLALPATPLPSLIHTTINIFIQLEDVGIDSWHVTH